MKTIRFSVLCSLFLVVLISGCARVYHVQVDSISDRMAVPNKVYQILSGNSNTSAGDLQFKEFASYLVKILSAQGYILADSTHPAEIEIYLSYGVGEPETHTYSYAQPVWGQTSTEIYSQTNQISPNSQITSTYIEPQYGVTGYTTQTGEYTVYKKYAILDAYDIKDVKPGTKLNEVWKTAITLTGKSKNIRKMIPVMFAGAARLIGTNTGGETAIDITEENESLKALRQ
jgi:hypothetical protein